MPKAVCIETGKEVSRGHRVKEDIIIKAIRWFKQKMGTLKGNILYVSEEAYEEHLKKRKRFERHLLIATGITIVLLVVAVFVPVARGDIARGIANFIPTLLLSIFFYLLALLSYAPSVEEEVTEAPSFAKGERKDSTKSKSDTRKRRQKAKKSSAKKKRKR